MATPRATEWKQLFALPEPSALPLQARLRLATVRAIVEAQLGCIVAPRALICELRLIRHAMVLLSAGRQTHLRVISRL